METTPKKELPQFPVLSLENYKHIELTQEELDAAILAAKIKKEGELALIAYREKLKRDKYADIVVPSYDEYKAHCEEIFTRLGIVIDEHNKHVVSLLISYFGNDSEFEKKYPTMSRKKGILLMGNIGTGKSMLMELFSRNPFCPYRVFDCRGLAEDFSKRGTQAVEGCYQTIEISAPVRFYGHEKMGLCLDDIGAEESRKHFGSNQTVIADIVQSRYQRDIPFQYTHATTNLTADQISAEYGERVRSRMREIFNVVLFPPEAIDRRK